MAKKTTKIIEQSKIKTCSIKTLPKSKWMEAADRAVELNHYNAPAVHQLNKAMPNSGITKAALALLTTKYWGIGGVKLTVGFLDNPTASLKKRILSHMNAWGNFSNVKFTASNVNPQVRISRSSPAPDDGYWSYLGTDILQVAADEPTMNLDSFTMLTPDSEFFRVVRHETGHTLGFEHEHLRSEIINKIDKEKAIALFMRTQNWTRAEVIAQVLTPIEKSALIATELADPTSIMCYQLPGEIMKDGKPIVGGTDINKIDAKFAASIYPKKK
jgi:Astacin (Peptidase family M12A)